MWSLRLLVRFVALLLFTVWVGGFTFYGAVVLPALHGAFGLPVAGGITQRISNPLNALGAVTLAVFWAVVWMERDTSLPARPRMVRLWLLVADSLLLLGLIAGHPVLDRLLAAGSLPAFDPAHRVYLWLSTLQWFVNVGLLAVTLALWKGDSPVSPDAQA